MMRPYAGSGQEPCLEEVFSDPLVHAVMRRDGVSMAHLRGLVATVAARLRNAAALEAQAAGSAPRCRDVLVLGCCA